jgi:hypothetical protein
MSASTEQVLPDNDLRLRKAVRRPRIAGALAAS